MFAAPQTSGQIPEDFVPEVEEPPEESLRHVAGFALDKGFTKQTPTRIPNLRRESLLTRQLQPKELDDDASYTFGPASRVLSSSSVAELTSDNELTSPGTRGSSPSPPLPPVRSHGFIPPLEKHFTKEPTIAEVQDRGPQPLNEPEHKVESGLGRRRCITFACGKKTEATKEPAIPVAPKADLATTATEAPKRKCMITFNCPTRTKVTPSKPLTLSSRHLSPAPKLHKSPKSPKSPRNMIGPKSRRGSDMTITTTSPSALRKMPSIIRRRNKYADAADEEKLEAKRFHEFAVNAHADEEWTEEITCHRKRLTIKDTLHKENVIRQIGEEVAEEEAEDEEDLDDDALLDELDVDDEDDDELDDDDDDDEIEEDNLVESTAMAQAGDSVSDRGFDTDDEQGFANSSESDGDDSDFEWWAPGRSTAATSTDQFEHIRSSQQRRLSDSSLESARQANGVTMKGHKKQKSQTRAVKINRARTPELPDSTDFVCGTLDEDRPLEQAYKLCLEQRKAAKHKVTPQDIDPTFPTSDPEMDEEDEEDEVREEVDDDDQQLLMHGPMDCIEERGRRNVQKSSAYIKSPSPRRFKSPAPIQRVNHKSPAPAQRRRSLRSPPPPVKCNRHRSPAPRKLFGQSPKRLRSPPPNNRPTSPPNSERSSVEGTPRPTIRMRQADCLGKRPVPTRVSSLPRVPTMTKIQTMSTTLRFEDDEDDSRPRRVRGAIDIVKGLEKKRQRRKEKLYQKHCQKLKKEGERKPKPGKGAERMRELGLELAAYRGKKAEHMISI